MRFVIRGREYGIDREQITKAVRGIAPDPFIPTISKYYVEINGQRYSIKQVIHLTTGLPNIAFTAAYAYRILQKLGFEIHSLGEDASRRVASVGIQDTLKFAITLEQDEDGFIVASCPALPGCHSQGRTREEAIANITEAIRGYIASMRKHGEPIPKVTEVKEVEVSVA